MTQMKKLYLVPTTLGGPTHTIPEYAVETIMPLHVFIVESLRSARRYLRSIGYSKDFDSEVSFFEMDKHRNQEKELWEFLNNNAVIGLLSDAGNPCIADPGNMAVEMAHQMGFSVQPLVGPNSILMALIASGMNGQNFTFHGYLPIDATDRKEKLRRMEQNANRTGYTQLFMETPYRNMKLIEMAVAVCKPQTRMCVACDISLETEHISTKKMADWKKDKTNFHKRPAVFAIGN